MTADRFIWKCEAPARRLIQGQERQTLLALARKHTGRVVLASWERYLQNGGYDVQDFSRQFDASGCAARPDADTLHALTSLLEDFKKKEKKRYADTAK